MKKRNQWNVNLTDEESSHIAEYCRVHDRTPQWLFKVGAFRIIDDDIRMRQTDLMTIKSWKEINAGKSEPIDDLLQMMEDDRRTGDTMLIEMESTRKVA
jgi:hypothetical protein